jgi:hypothetical protein
LQNISHIYLNFYLTDFKCEFFIQENLIEIIFLSLIKFCLNTKKTLEEDDHQITIVQKKKIYDTCKETLEWLDSNQNFQNEELLLKFKEIEIIFSPVSQM